MERRIVGSVALVAATLVVAGCIPAPPPPPPGWTAPVVTATVSPDPVLAGEPFRVEVTATTDVTAPTPDSVTAIDIEVEPPAGFPTAPVQDVSCEPGEFTGGPTGTQAFTCLLSEHAPNGEWRLTARARSAAAPSYRGLERSTFQVAGGSDDHQPPQLVSAVVSPNPVVIGQPFSITIRAFDDNHLPPAPTTIGANLVLPAPPEGTARWTCTPVTPTVVDDEVLEWRFTDCVIPEGSSPWTMAGGIEVTDALGHRKRLSVMFAAVDG